MNEKGVISPSQVLEAMRKDTILVSIMALNNEIGSINPIKDIADIEQNPKLDGRTMTMLLMPKKDNYSS